MSAATLPCKMKYWLYCYVARSTELCNITDWAHNNNLTLNLAKSREIIFVDTKQKAKFSVPITIPELQRVQMLNILGVTLTNGLSVS